MMLFDKKCFLGVFFLGCAVASIGESAYTLKNGKLVDAKVIATLSVQEHFGTGSEAFAEKDWKEAAKQFKIVSVNFPSTPYGQEALYYLGVSFYYLEEFDFANAALSDYLKCKSSPKFFQDAVGYKFAIAEQFNAGARRRFLGTKQLPKWASGKTMALKIYDEVIAAVPCHEIAAQALMSKGRMLWKMKDYRESIEAFQMVVRRFPKHELAPECYVFMSKVFLEQCQSEFQNPDILAFAQINLRRFLNDFPREERLSEVEQDVLEIKEVYARGLYDTGQFYERIDKPKASLIYYQNAIQQFPDTCIASLCRERLWCLSPSSIPCKEVDNAVLIPAEPELTNRQEIVETAIYAS